MTTPHTPGVFVWHEYLAPDPAPAIAFYRQVFGWEILERAEYPEAIVAGKHVAGFQTMAEVPAALWYGYVSVPDADAAAAEAQAAGGAVVAGPMSHPGVGRFAILRDPQGGVLAVLTAEHGDPDPAAVPSFGEPVWDSLSAPDPAAAGAFYARVVGWEAAADPQGAGAVFRQGDAMEASYGPGLAGEPAAWLMHVIVEDLAAARGRVEAAGGRVLRDEIALPYGKLAICADPLGAAFGLFAG